MGFIASVKYVCLNEDPDLRHFVFLCSFINTVFTLCSLVYSHLVNFRCVLIFVKSNCLTARVVSVEYGTKGDNKKQLIVSIRSSCRP